MPSYYHICRECGYENEVLDSAEEYLAHNDISTAITCPNCGKITSIYSLSKVELSSTFDNVLNFYPPGTREKFFRGLMGFGQND